MEEACVSREKRMTMTRHRDSKSYAKYSREEVDLSNKVLQRIISTQGTSFQDVYADEFLRKADAKVTDVLKVGNVTVVSVLQGTVEVSKLSKVVVGNSAPISNEMKRIVIANEGKLGHVFKENNNCQIINLVINGVDSQFTAAEFLKNLGPVPFL